jgi:hypothetical protein
VVRITVSEPPCLTKFHWVQSNKPISVIKSDVVCRVLHAKRVPIGVSSQTIHKPSARCKNVMGLGNLVSLVVGLGVAHWATSLLVINWVSSLLLQTVRISCCHSSCIKGPKTMFGKLSREIIRISSLILLFARNSQPYFLIHSFHSFHFPFN